MKAMKEITNLNFLFFSICTCNFGKVFQNKNVQKSKR